VADDAMLLSALGYDVTRPAAAIAAFKRHWVPDDRSPELTPEQRGLVQCLIGKQQAGSESLSYR
jgi:hypothetical protein